MNRFLLNNTHMFVKLFTQILDSSIADNRKLRHLFTDLLLCADAKGYIMMTPSAIARRIGATVEEVEWGLAELQKPDPLSKTKTERGKRIEPMEGAGYGWKIINYESYRAVRDADQLREAARVRLQRHREKKKAASAGNVSCNAGNAMQKERAEAESEEEPEAEGESIPPAPAIPASPEPATSSVIDPAPTMAQFLKETRALGVPDDFAKDKYLAKCEKGWDRNWKPYACRVLSWFRADRTGNVPPPQRQSATQQPAQPAQPIDKRSDLEKHLDYWNAADALGKKPVDFGAWLRAGKPEN